MYTLHRSWALPFFFISSQIVVSAEVLQAQEIEFLNPFEKALKKAEGDPEEQAKIKRMCFYMMPNFGNEDSRTKKCGCNYESAPYGHYEDVTYDCFSTKFNQCMESKPDPSCYNKACIRCLRSVRAAVGEPIIERLTPIEH